MFIIIGGDGKEYGPVTADQMRTWIKADRANLETKAKALGSDAWKRLGDFTEFFPADGAPPVLGAEPAPALPAGPQDANSLAEDLRTRAQALDVFSCLDRSFQLWKNNFLPLVGATLLVVVVQMAIEFIPILGAIAGLFLNAIFYGGLYYYYLGKMRGQHRKVGDVFAGFKRAPFPLMLVGLLTTALTVAVLVLFCAPLISFFFNVAIHGQAGGKLPDLSPLAIAGVFVGGLLITYLSVCWMFTIGLVIDKNLGPWTAMEVSRRVVSKQWFRVFFVAILGMIMTMLGIIALFVGVLFTIPLVIGAILYAYEDLCNPPPKN